MEIPKTGDEVVRTEDGTRFRVTEVIDAGGENLYRIQAESGEALEIEGGAFVKAHDGASAAFEVVR